MDGMDVAETESWLSAARLGDPAALQLLYRSYQASLYILCYRLVGNEDDAQDAMQAAFISAFRGLPQFRGESSMKTWLYRIATNECIALIRRRKTSSGNSNGIDSCSDKSSAACSLKRHLTR